MKVDIELYYVGDKFYLDSKSIMSSIYRAGTHERYDWGFVNHDLRSGKSVFIRQATNEEFGLQTRNLLKILEEGGK